MNAVMTLLKLVLIIMLSFVHFLFSEETVLVNRPSSLSDTRYVYPEKLLKEVLKRTESKYGKATVQYSKFEMTRKRVFHTLLQGTAIHVIAEAPKPNWEEKLIPVRIPIRKGIQGLRFFLVTKKNKDLLMQVRSLDDLRKISTGSGQHWSTTAVLTYHKFNVVTGNNYEGLFKMMMGDRFISFNRGINEVYVEYEARKKLYPDLIIDESLLLYIPLPTYFFVSPRKPKLAERIEEGLLAMIEDGSFDKFFEEHFGELLRGAQLDKRKVFRLTNPNLSKETPFNIKKFWYLQESRLIPEND